MPTYEYRCPRGHEFEKFFRTMSAAQPVLACPECGELASRQMSAGGGLMFKGSGFYLTDYGKNAHSSKGPAKPAAKSEGAPASESKSESKSDSAGGSSSESKPAATPAPPPKPTTE